MMKNKKIKKLVCCILLSIITCFGLFACEKGNGEENNEPTSNGFTVSQTVVVVEEKKSVNVFVNVEEGYTGDYTFTWTSADDTIAQAVPVSSKQTTSGRIIGKKVGTTKVTVKEKGGKYVEIDVTVEPYIASTASVINLVVGEKEAFPITSTAGVAFTVKNDRIASVAADGTITALAAGRTLLTATKGEKAFNVELQVDKADILNLVLDEAEKNTARLPLSDKTGFTFESKNASVATVDSAGIVTAVGGGETKVVATNAGVSYEYDVAVIGNKAQKIVFGEQVDERVSVYGRTNYVSEKGRMFYFAPAGFDVTFYGTELKADMHSEKSGDHYTWLSVFVDGESLTDASVTGDRIVKLETSGERTIVSGLEAGWHTVKIRKRTPYISGSTTWDAFGVKSITTDGYFGYANNKSDFRIDVYGDSISCGYGNLTDGASLSASNTDGVMAWESLLAHEIGADLNVAAASGWGIAYDAGCNSANAIKSENAASWNLWTKNNAYDKLTPNHSTTSGYATGTDLILINLGTNDHTGINAGGDKNYVSKKLMYWLFALKKANPETPIVSMYGMMGVNADTQKCLQDAVNAVQGAIEALNAAKIAGKIEETAIQDATAVIDANVKINDATAQVEASVSGLAHLIYADTTVTADIHYLRNTPVNGGSGHPLVAGHRQAAQEVLSYLLKTGLLK